ncbi:MAG: hypothetical protein ICV70_01835 [Jiangellaceae bacterium]|nr:hypothetical protein [Jiangellaceae bacterium]
MHRNRAAIVAAGAVGLAGLVGTVVASPAATAAVSAVSTATSDRVEAIADALASLVQDGTITQEQANAVAETLADELPAGGHVHGLLHLGLDVAAEELGLTDEELRDRLGDGATLAEIAEEQGVDVDDLVDALVTAAEERLAAAVEDGRIDQERADDISADLEERVRTFVEEGLPPRLEGGPGRHGHGHAPWFGPDRDREQDDSGTATPSVTQTT